MIVYHGMPGGLPKPDEVRVYGGRHLLCSLETCSDADAAWYASIAASLMLDNGAYTAWRCGRRVDMSAYAERVDRMLALPTITCALIPDLIDGSEADNDDLLYAWPRHLREWGVPVWHLHETTDRLARLMDLYPRMVALGSSGEYARIGTQAWWRRMDEAMCVAATRPHCRLHGLRMAARSLRALPLASVDSTTAARHAAAGVKFPEPFRSCKAWVRVEAYCQHLEGEPGAMAWGGIPRDAEAPLFAVLAGTEEG